MYFNGGGNMSEVLIKTKICSKCHQEKELREFYTNNGNHVAHCIKCEKEIKIKKAGKRYEIIKPKCIICGNNIDFILWFKACGNLKTCGEICKKENKSSYRKKWLTSHPGYRSDKKKEEYKNWYIKNKEMLKIKNKEQKKEYYLKNKETIREYKRVWTAYQLKNNQNFLLKNLIRHRINESIKRNKRKKYTSTLNLIGCTFDNLRTHLGITDKYDSSKYHIDHIIPCAAYDLTDHAEQKKCFNWRNLRLIDAKENLSKNDKLDMKLVHVHKIEHLLPNNLIKNK